MHQTMDKDTITVGALSVRFLVEAADSNGTAAVFECYVPANSRMPAPHSHDGFEETIYGLEGATTWTIDGETIEIGPARRCASHVARSTGLEPQRHRREVPRDRHPRRLRARTSTRSASS